VLRYEDLFEGAAKAARFREMLDFATSFPDGFSAGYAFDAAILERRSHSSRGGAFPGWRQWDPALAARVEELCGTTMRLFGYGAEPEWAEKVTQGGAPAPVPWPASSS
jgi:hypothetical protein